MSDFNIASRLSNQAIKTPDKAAVRFAPNKINGKWNYRHLSFKELEYLANQFAFGMNELGIKKGSKVLVFVRPSLKFSAITFSLFKLGAIPIFIDPGMGRKNLFKAIKDIKPIALIAEPEVHFARLIFRSPFKSIKYFITTANMTWPGMKKLNDFKTIEILEPLTLKMEEEDPAAILFTSGGTGTPKGVLYTHGIFTEQTKILQEVYSLTNNDTDLPGFPLFSLFTIAMGMTSAIPNMDPSKPSKACPKTLVENITDNQATFIAGSPAIWERVAEYCIKNEIQLPSVKYVVMFGAPVSIELHEQFAQILPNGSTYTPYGATECLPVTNTSGKEILFKAKKQMEEGFGTFLGSQVPGARVEIIPITERPWKTILEDEFLPINQIGEIVVQSKTVTPEYVGQPEKTLLAKMHDESGKLWHRMGDLGYKDEQGNIWFCGRKTHRVIYKEKLHSSVQCEAIFNKHPKVKRSALVQYTNNLPAIVLQTKNNKLPSKSERNQILSDLKIYAQNHEHTKDIKTFFFKQSFPVDIRHNIKIDRLKLSKEAQRGTLK